MGDACAEFIVQNTVPQILMTSASSKGAGAELVVVLDYFFGKITRLGEPAVEAASFSFVTSISFLINHEEYCVSIAVHEHVLNGLSIA